MSELMQTTISAADAVATTEVYRVAIIGCGPKGLYAFERLVAYARRQPATPLVIDLYDSSGCFGAGRIYQPNQPRYLLMNVANHFINGWTTDSAVQIVADRPTLVEWLQRRTDAPVSPHAYSPRAVVGEYLQSIFLAILRALPAHIKVRTFSVGVTDVQAEDDNFYLTTTSTTDRLPRVAYQQLLLTTGYPPPRTDQFLAAGTQFVPFVYPVTRRLAQVKKGRSVAIKGLGLTFIDTVLALTEGRAGQFIKTKNGKLRYEASGDEPQVIYPFSRSGLLMIPRQSTDLEAQIPLRYFNKKQLAEWDMAAKIDFTTTVLPALQRELRWIYYATLFREDPTFSIDLTETQLTARIADFHQKNPAAPRFNFNHFISYPFGKKNYPNLHDQTLAFIENSSAAAELGEAHHPLAAAVAVWRRIADWFGKRYKNAGFTAATQHDFLANYAGHFNRIAYGPPVENMRKIQALAEAGVLNFNYCRAAEATWNNDQQKFILTTPTQSAVAVQTLIDARIPRPDLSRTTSELYRNLVRKNYARPFKNCDHTGECVPGGVAIADKTGQLLYADGSVFPQLAAYGTPTEGATFDNDSLTRGRNNLAEGWAQATLQQIEEYRTVTTL